MTPADVRAHLGEALEADLVGPFDRKPGETHSMANELLSMAPSRWYLTGFLAPREHRDEDDEDPNDRDDGLALGDVKDDDTPAPDPSAKKKARLPASIGLSMEVPAGTKALVARVSWADYEQLAPNPDAPKDRYSKEWVRIPRAPVEVRVPLDAALTKGIAIEGSNGLILEGQAEPFADSLSVAVFLVNARDATRPKDQAFAFQVRLELHCAEGFVGRTNETDETSSDTDERTLDLQYRELRTYAVGHGVAADWVDGARVTTIATSWFPKTLTPRVEPTPLKGMTVDMEKLAELTDAKALESSLSPMVVEYAAWIAKQRALKVGDAHRTEVKDHLLGEMERARKRISEGIALLANDPEVLRAFTLANRAMALAQRRRNTKGPARSPAWRLFQLAFVVMNLPSIASEQHADRKTVELIFFPTGGGKTEAYLGLIAFTLVLRRLRAAKRPDGGLGVAVILRYTLRLLTLDQLGRAATLICALETLRRQGIAPGDARYTIGLWVGRSATANTLEQAAKAVTEFKNETSLNAPSPYPLTACPWCQTALNRDGFSVRPNPTRPEEIAVGCMNAECDFTLRKEREGLPVLFVDEQIYRELPSFLISTVDKFALLPWRGETGMLFGRVHSRDGKRFFGPCDSGRGPVLLNAGLKPPELIIQDELHLISGPLGSMVGLYEAAIDQLCPGAKLVASTATVRRARQQIQRLYGREDVAVFPPTGLAPSETFFSREAKGGERQYLGVAAPGRPMKTILLRVYASLLASAYRLHDPRAETSAADPYLTLVGYFNSLRELGGMRRLVDDEVRRQVSTRGERKPPSFTEPNPWYRSRSLKSETVELTSREKTAAIAWSKTLLERPIGEDGAVEVLLASNMISVGVDIDRLGLMVIAGQPKTTSEYIQSSSRVGRRQDKPGLVVTVFNVAKPRDRSHFERFIPYHRSFYRHVEATSVTPWSAPALDRGLAGVAVAAARLTNAKLTPADGVMDIRANRAHANALADAIAARAAVGLESESARSRAVKEVRARLSNLLDAWERIIEESRRSAGRRQYSALDQRGEGKSLVFAWGDEVETRDLDELKFMAPLSMRDVEPSVHLWVRRRQPLGGRTNG